MRKQFFLLIALMLGITRIASADVPDGVWTIPEPQGLEFMDWMPTNPDEAYLYNPAAKMFLASGNEWNSRASLATFGYNVWFTDAEESDAPEGTYVFHDYCNHPDRMLGERNLFTEDNGATWVDNNGNWQNYSWLLTFTNGFVRIQNAALIADKPEFDGKYLGWKGDYSDTRLYMIEPSENAAIDWRFVTYDSYQAFIESEGYEAYQKAIACYYEAVALKAVIESAEALGANISTWLAVYTNTVSTADELKAATDSLTPIVEAREALKGKLDEVKDAGFAATADYDAVYDNADATEAQLKKALQDLNAAVIEWGKTHASAEHPIDMTSKIVNPNFDNASYAGWLGTAPNMVGPGSHGPANVCEKWNDTFDTYQNIEGLPAGVYVLGAQTMWRGSWNDMKNNIGPAAFLYAKAGDVESKVPFNYAYGPLNTESMAGDTPWGVGAGEQSYTDEETGITYYIPNDPSCFRLYAEKGLYDTKVLFVVNEGDTVRIGVKNPAKMGDADNWTCFDTFTLSFYGNGADACQLYLNEAMKNVSEYVIEEGVLYTAAYLTAYLTAYQQAFLGEKNASTMAEVDAVIGGINKAKVDLDKNIKLWKDYLKACDKADKMRIADDYKDMESDEWFDLCDYIDEDYENIIKEVKLTNEELEAEIVKITGWIATVEEQSKQNVYDGKNMTKFIKNPGFDEDENKEFNGAEGWTIDRISGGNVVRGPLGQNNQNLMKSVLGEENFCFESWHCHKWDIWQEVKNLPKGMYELQVQGYVRCEVGGYTQGDELGDQFPSPVYLYMNNAMSSFPSVYSEQVADEHYVDGALPVVEGHSWNGALANYPNSMGAASLCFKWGMYKTTAYGLIAKEGDKFRIGVKMDKNQDWWCIFDNFKLIYRTPTAALVKPLLEEELAKINLEQPMGKNVFAQAAQVKKDAEAAIAANDGQAMFDALSAAYDLSASIIASSSLFNDLAKANESFYESLSNYTEASTAALAAAGTLYTTISDGIENHEYEDAEVEGLLNQIKAMRTKLAFPEGWENATDAKPAECTMAIQSNSFFDEFNYVNTAEGWKNPGNLGNDDTQKSAQAMEFWQRKYDMYQTIVGLPEGTYIISADAWCRMGSNDENYSAWKADSAATMAYLYAVGGGDSTVYSVPVANMMKAGDALMESTGYDDEIEFTTWNADGSRVTYYLPGSMVSGKGIIEMNEGVYTNKVIAKVGADGKLTIGIKKDQEKTNSWVICDDFRLFYCGNNSQQETDNVSEALNELIAQATELLEKRMAGNLRDELTGAISIYSQPNAENVHNGLTTISNLIKRARVSIGLYEQLEAKMNDLSQKMENGKHLNQEIVEGASNFLNDLNELCSNEWIEEEEEFTEFFNELDRFLANISPYDQLDIKINELSEKLEKSVYADTAVVAEATDYLSEIQIKFNEESLSNVEIDEAVYIIDSFMVDLNWVYLTINVETAGTLKTLVGEIVEGDYGRVRGLTISGSLNDEDVDFIWRKLRSLMRMDMAETNLTSLKDCDWYVDEETGDGYFGMSARDQLQRVVLPKNLVSIGNRCFVECWELQEIVFPETLQSIGNEAFAWCGSLSQIELPSSLAFIASNAFQEDWLLRQITCKAMLPPTVEYGDLGNLDYSECTLIVPAWSVSNYMETEPWSWFNIVGGNFGYGDNLTVISDVQLNTNDSIFEELTPNVSILRSERNERYGALTVDGATQLSAKNFEMYYDFYMNLMRKEWGDDLERSSAVLIANAPMSAESVTLQLRMKSNVWNFFSLLFDAKVGNITSDLSVPYVIYKYDGKKRADSDMNNTWVRMTADSTLHAGEGYIWQCGYATDGEGGRREDAIFRVTALNTANMNNIFVSDNAEISMKEYASEYAQNRSWNLLGNPYPSYFAARAMDITAPFTVWNLLEQNYEAYSPVDDDYVFMPGEAFFLQRPADQASIYCVKEGRQTDGGRYDRHFFAGTRQSELKAKRSVFNLTLSGDSQSDRTRFVMNEKAQMGYEMDKDASKFAGMNASAPQLYTIEQGLHYAINERPLQKGEVQVGMTVAQRGTYTLKLDTKVDNEVYLIDRLKGSEILLTEEGYAFEAEAGTTDDRFVVRLGAGEVTGIKSLTPAIAEGEGAIYDLQGRRVNLLSKQGLYLQNGKKVLMRSSKK